LDPLVDIPGHFLVIFLGVVVLVAGAEEGEGKGKGEGEGEFRMEFLLYYVARV